MREKKKLKLPNRDFILFFNPVRTSVLILCTRYVFFFSPFSFVDFEVGCANTFLNGRIFFPQRTYFVLGKGTVAPPVIHEPEKNIDTSLYTEYMHASSTRSRPILRRQPCSMPANRRCLSQIPALSSPLCVPLQRSKTPYNVINYMKTTPPPAPLRVCTTFNCVFSPSVPPRLLPFTNFRFRVLSSVGLIAFRHSSWGIVSCNTSATVSAGHFWHTFSQTSSARISAAPYCPPATALAKTLF